MNFTKEQKKQIIKLHEGYTKYSHKWQPTDEDDFLEFPEWLDQLPTEEAEPQEDFSGMDNFKLIEHCEAYVDKWIKSHEPDTFIKSDVENEGYWYTSKNGQSSVNLGIFFANLLEDYLEEHKSTPPLNQSNPLSREKVLKILKSCYKETSRTGEISEGYFNYDEAVDEICNLTPASISKEESINIYAGQIDEKRKELCKKLAIEYDVTYSQVRDIMQDGIDFYLSQANSQLSKGRDDEWISVEYRLPETDESVFIATQVGGTSTCFYKNSRWKYAISSRDIPPELSVTHWMKLPLPPIPKDK